MAVDKAGNVSLPATARRSSWTSRRRSSPSPRPAAGASVAGRWTCGARPTAATTSRSTGCSWARARAPRLDAAAALVGARAPRAAGRVARPGRRPARARPRGRRHTGNRGRVTRPVVVDTQPPGPPVLVEVARPPAPTDRLVPAWQPSPSTDVAGYLVYRNGRLANAGRIVLGDLTRLPRPRAHHDGRRASRRRALLQGGGHGRAPATSRCLERDLPVAGQPRARAPYRAAGRRDPLRLPGARRRGDARTSTWRASGSSSGPPGTGSGATSAGVRSAPPWEATLDPDPAGSSLSPGDYELRAVATDRAGQRATPPRPRSRSTYGDTTPPPAPDRPRRAGGRRRTSRSSGRLSPRPTSRPTGCTATASGSREGLDRAAARGPRPRPRDLRVRRHRGGRGRERERPERPRRGGRLRAASRRARTGPWPRRAFAPREGDGSRPRTTVRGPPRGHEGRGGGGDRRGLPGGGGSARSPTANLLRARGEDAAGNRSIPSNEIVLIANRPPAAVSGPRGRGGRQGRSLCLDAGRRRRPLRLRGPPRRPAAHADACRRTTRASIEATSSPDWAALAFDGNPATAWPPAAATGEWTVTSRSPILVERIRLRFAGRRVRGRPRALHGPRAVAGPVRARSSASATARARGRATGCRPRSPPPRSAWPWSPRAASPRWRSTGSTSSPPARARSTTTAAPEASQYDGRRDRPLRRRGRRGHRRGRRRRRRAPGAAHGPRGDAGRPGRAAHLEPEPRAGRRRATSCSATARASARRAAPGLRRHGAPERDLRYTVIAVDGAGLESGESGPGHGRDRRAADRPRRSSSSPPTPRTR